MKRHFFTILSTLSLALCAATCVLWIGSYFSEQSLWFSDAGISEHNSAILVSRGKLEFVHDEPSTRDYDVRLFGRNWSYCSVVPLGLLDFDSSAIPVDWSFLGLTHTWMVDVVPLWLPALLFAALPSTKICREIKRRQLISSNFCSICGYDLRATSDRCPECGTDLQKIMER